MERGKSADSGAGDDAWIEVKGKRKGKGKSADSGAGAGVQNSSITTAAAAGTTSAAVAGAADCSYKKRYNLLNYLSAVQKSSSTNAAAAVAGAADSDSGAGAGVQNSSSTTAAAASTTSAAVAGGCSYKYPLSSCYNHPNYLRDSENNDLDVESLDDYLSHSPIPTVESYRVFSKYVYEKLGYTYVPDVHTAHIRAMVQYLCDIHKLGVSVKRLDESNLVVQGGKLKFRGLEFVEFAEDEEKVRDYKHLHDIIKNMIVKHNRNNLNFPILFDDLLHTMKNDDGYSASVAELLLTNHLAIQSHEKRLEYIKNYFDNASYIRGEDRKTYDTVVGKMSRKEIHSKDWTKRFDGSDLQVGPAKDCFDYEPKVKEAYKGTGPPEVVNHHILRFCRNMAVHLPQHIRKHTKSWVDMRDVDLTIMALFEHELLSFQRLAYEHGILKYFIPGKEGTSSSSGRSSSSGGRGQGRQSNSAGGGRQCYTPSSTTKRSSTQH